MELLVDTTQRGRALRQARSGIRAAHATESKGG